MDNMQDMMIFFRGVFWGVGFRISSEIVSLYNKFFFSKKEEGMKTTWEEKEDYDFEKEAEEYEKRILKEAWESWGPKGMIVAFSGLLAVFFFATTLTLLTSVLLRWSWIPALLTILFIYFWKNKHKLLSQISQRRKG